MDETHQLTQIATMMMPFGKYKSKVLLDLPEEYLLWFRRKGWPEGKLGMLLQLTLEIKINGQEKLLAPLRRKPVKF